MNTHRNDRNLEKIKRTNFYVLIFNALFYGFGSSLYFIVYVPFLYEFTDSILIIGVITTLGSVLQFLPMPWIGRLSDKYGRKLFWYFDTPLMILGLFFFIIANNLFIVVVGVLSYSFGFGIGYSIYQVLVLENSKDTNKGFNYGILGFLMSVGSIAGSFFVLANSGFNRRIFFLIFIIILGITYLFVMIFITDPIPRKYEKKLRPRNPTKTEKGSWKKILTTSKTRAIVFYFTFDAFIYSISISIYSAGIINQYQITQEYIAILSLCSNISFILFQIPAGHLTDKIGKTKTLILSESFGLSFFSLLIMSFFLWSSGFEFLILPLLITGEIIWAVKQTTFIPSEAITTTNLDENRRAESFGILALIRGIGVMPTGIIAGILISRVHYIVPFVVTIMGIIFKIWFLLKFFDRDSKKAK